jgi:hypothetical protein
LAAKDAADAARARGRFGVNLKPPLFWFKTVV